jgi:hypothetical protein
MNGRVPQGLFVVVVSAALSSVVGCRDASRFSNRGDHFEGDVVKGSFVRAGVTEDARMCVTLDAEHLQDTPGTITTSDDRFRNTPLRPIPQIWHDPLSTLSFGDGRKQNLVYVATPRPTATDTSDVMIFLSLMDEGGLEVRVLRGAPQSEAGAPQADAAAPAAPSPVPIFGIFTLERREGTCTF